MKLCSEIIALAMGRGEEGLAAPPASSLALRCRLRQVSHKLLITHVHASRSHILRPARAPPFQSGTPSPTPRAPLQALQSPLPAKERIQQPRVPQTPKILGALMSLLPTPHPEDSLLGCSRFQCRQTGHSRGKHRVRKTKKGSRVGSFSPVRSLLRNCRGGAQVCTGTQAGDLVPPSAPGDVKCQ